MCKRLNLFFVLIFIFSISFVFAGDGVILIDNMKKSKNNFNGRCAVYQRKPSRIGFSKTKMDRDGKKDKVLKLRFDKKGQGGPYGNGGWCGYYSIVKKGNKFLDAGAYKKLTLWVKGKIGGEKFKVGAADQQMEKAGDSVKAEDISTYLKAKKITTSWQKAVIPLDDMFIDWKELASISINFETDLYEKGAAKGTVYIDNIQLEK